MRLSQIVWRRWQPAVIASAVYLLLCIVKSGPIGLVTGHTWQHWWDQGAYLRSTTAFAHGDLSPASHWYPLLYPLLAVPFLLLLPYNPFLLLDLLCVALLAQSVTRVARHLGIGQTAALLILLLTCLWPSELWHAWVQPWTTTLSAALIWWLMAKAGDVAAAPDQIRPRDAAAIGFVAALVPLARPADAIILLLVGGYVALVLIRHGALRLPLVGAALVGAIVPLAVYGMLHLAIYGPVATDYMRLSGDIGLWFGDIGWKASILFLDPSPWFAGDKALLARMPWVVLGLAGALFVLVRPGRDARRGYAAFLLTIAAVYVLVMTAYVDLLPSGLWRFNNIHYFKWILPLLGMTAWLFLRDARHRPLIAAASFAAIFIMTGLRVVPVPALPDQPARRIDFPAPAGTNWTEVYFAQSVIVEGTRVRRNIFDYRQILDGDTVHALALRGDFTPAARWHGGGLSDVAWPPAGTAPLPGTWPAAPSTRWKGRLTWGLPCWIGGCTVKP
jgi:hypothetical protein